MKKLLFISLLVLNACTIAKNVSQKKIDNKYKITYQLSMPQPQTHYFEVEMTINENLSDSVLVKMPVWAPGSYLIREFARHVEGFTAKNDKNEELITYKKNKNTWVVKSKNSNRIIINYSVYANEISVRTSFIDADHGYLNGTSIFMYVPGLQDKPSILTIEPYKDWSTISTGLEPIGKNQFTAPNYDILADSPIEIGNQKVLAFDLNGIKHNVAMVGNYTLDNETKLLEDLKKVCANATSICKENPCKNYTFIVQHYPSSLLVSGGGLEHLNSTTLIVRPETYTTAAGYRGFLSLAAHEYFHLWNVKRIRPVELGPFDYENENYTSMLWVAEGFTSFFQDYILRKGNQISEEDYLKLMTAEIATIENQPGAKVMSVSESSFDAWIKYYRQNENSRNSSISYYDKGGVLGMMFNLMIIGKTDGEKSIDDVFQILWKNYKNDGKGYTEAQFRNAIEQVLGENLSEFFRKYINGKEEIPYNSILEKVGLRLEISDSKNASLGASIGATGKIGSVMKGSSAYLAGLNANDEIIDIDEQKLDKIGDYLKSKSIGDEIKISFKRFGIIRKLNVKLSRDLNRVFEIKPIDNQTDTQRINYKKWLFL